ncbi:MAG: glycosyltransferase family 4 protein [Moorea sp. SIOASIH]|uniref:glycosyltransferase family 4 protein n=1 Tax=Moorena sp. SIOASIH TaxID=2607817 RepID=UPI0013BB5C82|nr:glycosyltransferase family 4 protein [Moorena sp. SIOASIH]NEO39513.1 glycosyltransferase family 4 protein [Moorena sp. SIOASIH]
MKQQLRVGFFSFQNYLDKNTFSGILYYMHKSLASRDIELINLGNPKEISNKKSYWNKLGKPIQLMDSLLCLKYHGQNKQLKRFIVTVQKQLTETPCDLLFCPVASGELSFLETKIPILFLSDATPKLINNEYYKSYETLEEFYLAEKHENGAISKSNKLVYSSKWAANSAISDYQADRDKVEVITFGANLDDIPSIDQLFYKSKASRCRLLFIGKDWQRKGGNIAFNTLKSLLSMGIDAELVMVGCIPPEEIKHERLKVIPFLNKNIPEERERLNQLFLQSHFFIFPTRADCSPIVICEANAFGLPVITTDVGGIPTIIQEGKNGYMLTLSDSSDQYASVIANNFRDRAVYKQLVKSSREEYDQCLNWDKWAERIHRVMISMFN